MFKLSPDSLQTFIDTRLTLTPSAVPNYNYSIMVSDWNCLKHVCVSLYSNHQVYGYFLITLYIFEFYHTCLDRTRVVLTKHANVFNNHLLPVSLHLRSRLPHCHWLITFVSAYRFSTLHVRETGLLMMCGWMKHVKFYPYSSLWSIVSDQRHERGFKRRHSGCRVYTTCLINPVSLRLHLMACYTRL
jgi:hypothetical protein